VIDTEALPAAPARAVDLRALERPPLGLVFASCAAALGGAVSLLHLDRLPFTLCAFKQLTGLPCPTCGSTRALGQLALFDLGSAFAMNPLAATAAFVLLAWALADLALLPRRLSVRLVLRPDVAPWVRLAFLLLAASNWVFLLLSGR
jgi:hypothetical protein